MGSVTRRSLVGALVTGMAVFHAATAAHAQIGTAIPDLEMNQLGGGSTRLLANAAASVLVFFRPHQPNSLKALRELADCQKRFTGATTRWVAIVSSTAPPEAAASVVREAGINAPIVVDPDDSLYGALGVVLHPVVVIVDRDHRLAAFEPFRSVNLCAIVTARLRRVLGEITEAQMQHLLDPPKALNGGDTVTARRNLRLAESLFKAGNRDQALEALRRSLELERTSAPAHALLGEILAAQGKCADAVQAFGSALKLDPGNARAQQGIEGCRAAR